MTTGIEQNTLGKRYRRMQFSFEGSKIVCQRVQESHKGDILIDVAQFDAQVDTVPPHVAGKLSSIEVKDLEMFQRDKVRLQAKGEHRAIIEALPALIEKARGVLISVNQIDEILHQQLTIANERLGTTLLKVEVEQGKGTENAGSMSTEENLKVRLDVIARSL
ncbi:MAG: hypothetical protein ACJAXW_002181 [Candidatus Azotimanducaceae bacterium]|jgi:hypothetical protein